VGSRRAATAVEKGDVYGRLNPATLGTIFDQVGECYSSMGRFEEALPWFERAVTSAEKGDVHGYVDLESLRMSLDQVGECYSSMGKFEEARLWFERASKVIKVAIREGYPRRVPVGCMEVCCDGSGRTSRDAFDRSRYDRTPRRTPRRTS